MIQYFVNQLTNSASARGILQERETAVFRYGLQAMLEVAAVFTTLLLLACWMDMAQEAAAFTLVTIVGRTAGGGYHARRFRSCYLLSVGVFLLSMLAVQEVPFSVYPFILAASAAGTAIRLLRSRAVNRTDGPWHRVQQGIDALGFLAMAAALGLAVYTPFMLALALGYGVVQLSALCGPKGVSRNETG